MTLRDENALECVRQEWEALHAAISPRVPFSTPLWCLSWWKHHRRNAIKARDDLRTYIVRDDDGALIAVAPMLVTVRPGRGPLAWRELQFFGADSNVTELRGVLCAPSRSAEVIEAISAQMRADGGFDWVQWRGLKAPLAPAAWPGTIVAEPRLDTVLHILHVSGSWDDFRARLPRNIKESLRKCYNSLARENVEIRVRVVRDPADVAAALDRFFELHRARAEAADTVRHANAFEDPRNQCVLRDVCTALAQQNGLRIFQILVADTVVATRIGFQFGTELYLYYSGYDLAWGRFSIMTTALAEAIKWALAHGITIVNLSTGTDTSKTRWRPESLHYPGAYALATGLATALGFKLLQRFRHPPLPTSAASPKPPLDPNLTAPPADR